MDWNAYSALVEKPKRRGFAAAKTSIDTMSAPLRELIRQYGNQEVVQVVVGRAPVLGLARAAVKLISGAMKQEWKGRQPYHLFQFIAVSPPQELRGITWIRIDKDEIVKVKIGEDPKVELYRTVVHPGLPPTTEVYPNPDRMVAGRPEVPTTLAEYFYNLSNFVGEDDQQHLWRYDPRDANCQHFVLESLDANHLLTSKAMYNFILRDHTMMGDVSKSRLQRVTDLARFWGTAALGADAPYGGIDDSRHRSRKRARVFWDE